MESEPDAEELRDWERIQSPSGSSTIAVVNNKEGFLGESSVFLPKNNEDLDVKAPEDKNQGGDDGRWRLKRLHSESVLCGWIARGIRNKFRIGFRSLALATAALALVYLLRRRPLTLNRGKESLLVLIKDKEKKINQLLLQIAQMNEVLRTRRTRVRVLRANDL